MKREGWLFRYQATEVAEAAREREKHHAERVTHWTSERDQAEAKLKEKGFEYRTRDFTGGHDVEIVGDTELIKHLANCKAAEERHKGMVLEYGRWIRALGRETGTLDLDYEDVVFFSL